MRTEEPVSAAPGPIEPGQPTPRSASAGRIARNTGLQSVGMAVSRIATLAFYVVMARTLGTEGFGDFAFALSIGVLVAVSGLGTDFAMTRDIARQPYRVHRLFWNATGIRFVGGAIGVAIALGVAVVAGYPGDVQAAIVILGAATWVDVLAGPMQSVFRGVEDMGPIALAWIVQRIFTSVVGSAALLLGAALVPVALIYFAGSLVGLAYIAVQLVRRHVRPRLELSWRVARGLMQDALPIAGANASNAVLARVDAVILSLLKGNAAVGIYSGAYRIFEGTLFVGLLFGLASFPVLARLGPNTTPTIGAAYEKGCKVLLLSLVPVGVTLVLFADPLVQLLYGTAYADSSFPLQVLGGVVPLSGLMIFSTYVLASQDRQRAVVWPLALGVALNIALNLALIPGYSVDGAAIAMTVSQAVITLTLVSIAVRTTGHVSLIRASVGSMVGAAGMAAAVLILDATLVAIPVALLLYSALAILVERSLYPDDLRFILRSIRRGIRVEASV